jgi:hypothetical protein
LRSDAIDPYCNADDEMYIVGSVKRLKIIFLSLLVSYAGVAWALEACLGHDRHSEHVIAEPHTVSDALVIHNDSHEPTVPIIRCTSENQEVGPAVRIASTTIPRPDKASPLQIASLSDVVSAALRNDLWLDAVFRRIVTISLPINLARHLFLSVLQI